MEEWRTCATHPQYEVSDLGRVRKGERIIAPHMGSRRSRYLRVNLWSEGEHKTVSVSRLVMSVFSEKIPYSKTFIITYRDEDPKNCAFKNLYYETRSKVGKKAWREGKCEKVRKYLFKKGHKPINAFKSGPLHHRWNPKSKDHLRRQRSQPV